MSLQTNNIYEFEDFRLDFSEKTLQGGGGVIPLTPKVFETLCVLVENAGHLIEKDELMRKLWQDRFVEESNLTFNIKMLRKALGDNAQSPQFIETVQSRGYRFIADVTRVECDERSKRPAAASQNSEEVTTFPTPVPQHRLSPSGARAIVNLAEWRQKENNAEGLALVSETATPTNLENAQTDHRFARQIKRHKPLAASVLAALLLGAVGLGYDFFFAGKTALGADGKRSIAVLPLKPINTANRDEGYEIGIADSLIIKLGSMKGFIVRPLSATRKYTDIGQDPIAAGKEQLADYVLATNYQLADGKIRITAQLFNVASGQVEETYKGEKDSANLFAMQDAIAGEVGNILLALFRTTSSGPTAKRGTDNEEAYRLYIQGTVLADKRNQIDSRKAIDYFEQAVRLDPNYALAYARLANAHSTLAYTEGSDDRDEEYRKGKAAIEKALAIDDNLAEAHSYLGEIKMDYDWDLAGAEHEDKRAVELNPNSSVVHRVYALLLGYLGRSDESIAESKTAIDLEPASAVNLSQYGYLLFLARRYEEAITESKRALEIDPEYYFAYNVLTNSYRLKGDDDKAFESFVQMRTLGEKPDEINSWKTIYAKSGWRGISGRQLEEAKAAEKKGKANYNRLAVYSIELGQNEQAFAYLEKAVVQRRPALITLKVNPRYDPLRSDPRYDELLRRVGL